MNSSNRGLLIALVVVLVVILVVPGLGWGMMGPGMMGPGMMGGWGWGGASPLWGVGMFVFWALIIGGVVLLVSWGIRQAGPGPGESAGRRPLDILKERYARGELNREQYEQMRRELE